MAEPLRVAHVMGKMLGGGVEAIVMNYYRNIDRSLVQFDFLVDEDSADVPRAEIELLGGRIFEVPPYQRAHAYRRALTVLFREQGWPIVHSHINALSVFPLSAARAAGVPIRIAHSHSTSGKGEPLKSATKTAFKRFANIYPTCRMACSAYAGEWLFGRGADFTVVRNAIDLSQFGLDSTARSRIRAELGVEEGQLLVGHIGRFVPQKNHALLLRIFREVLLREPHAVLALAGNGPLAPRIVDFARDLGVEKSVRFLGARSDTPALYQAFDVFCLPSLYEGLPVVGVECQASRTPLLASDAITREAAVTSLMEFESVDADPRVWADRLLALRKMDVAKADLSGLAPYDISAAAPVLADTYLSLADEEGIR